MKGRWLWVMTVAALVTVLALLFLRPHAWISPGNMIKGHESLEADCFACHTLLLGSRADKCVDCHELEKIGRFSTRGVPMAKPGGRPGFHQGLMEQDCMACHQAHRTFISHRETLGFAHGLLQPELRERCESCHAGPEDSLHKKVSGNCQQCHGQQHWKPTSFDHDRYFRLDRDHDVACDTCHAGYDFGRYGCYGCHEHRQEKIRREHEEEGIRDFENCVECHRDASEPEHGRRRGREREDN